MKKKYFDLCGNNQSPCFLRSHESTPRRIAVKTEMKRTGSWN